MRIAVSGTHGIGKSTVVEYISQAYGILPIREVARELLTRKYSFLQVDKDIRIFKEFQSEILNKQIERELSLREEGQSFVVDRTPLDSLAYVLERMTSERDLDLAYYEDYRTRVAKFLHENPYDKVFFLRYDPSFRDDDGFRNLHPLLMKAIDRIILQEFSDFEWAVKPVVEITDTSYKGREQLIDYHLGILARENLR